MILDFIAHKSHRTLHKICMAAPQPLSKITELSERVVAFVRSVGHVDAKDSMEFRRLVREAGELAKDDVVSSNCLGAILQGIVGNDAEAERLFANAAANKGEALVNGPRLAYLVNRMKFQQAYEWGKKVIDDRGDHDFHEIAHYMMAGGAFRVVRDAVDRSQKRGEVLQLTARVGLARVAAEVLDKLNISDSHCVQVLDALGELARKYGLIWLHTDPDISVCAQVGDEPAVMMSYRFAVSPERGAELGWEFTELLVQRGLDRPGFYVQVIGEESGVALAEPA